MANQETAQNRDSGGPFWGVEGGQKSSVSWKPLKKMFPGEGNKPSVRATPTVPGLGMWRKVDACKFKAKVDYLVISEILVSSCTVLSDTPPQKPPPTKQQ